MLNGIVLSKSGEPEVLGNKLKIKENGIIKSVSYIKRGSSVVFCTSENFWMIDVKKGRREKLFA